MVLEITVDFVLGVVPELIEGGLCVFIGGDEVIILFFVSLVHFVENSILMFFFESFDFDSAFLSIIIFSIGLVNVHDFVLAVEILLYFFHGSRHE